MIDKFVIFSKTGAFTKHLQKVTKNTESSHSRPLPKDRSGPLTAVGLGELLRANGSSGYGSRLRPDVKGPVAVAQSGTAGTPIGENLATSNRALALRKDGNEECELSERTPSRTTRRP